MTEREGHSLSPPVIRIKPNALSIVDTADSHTARPQHITDTMKVIKDKEGSMVCTTEEKIYACVSV